MKEETLEAVEIVGKILILFPTLSSLILLLYFGITGNSIELGPGFCLGTIVVSGIIMVGYSTLKKLCN
ncbi:MULTISPECIES: hypothetical protein [unclassified Archaeoglobus]|jgi:hypothetical protein|uniref:hypothetical protein n=1 Tax=unclassified Archaeoglobus TaxID=2643606 RepID=UPI0025B8E515|nr:MULTISPECIES: hypothetical protein [unclassified Archaeoglobus]